MSTPIKGKSRNKFESILCCWCFSKKKSQGDSDIYLGDDNEPYEYVLEKLAIKKVPVRLLTLTGDFPKKQSGNSENSSSTHSVQVTPAYLEEKPSVSFNSYYKLQTSDHIDDEISQSSKDHKSLSFRDDVHEKEIVNTALPLFSPRQTLTESQSKAIVADVLNKHSSLFTLGKDPIPKDPSHLPSNRTVVPPSVKHAIKKQEKTFPSRIPVYEREVYAEVHHAPSKKSNLKDAFSLNRQDMAPSIQNTIDSLKYTQKPHLPGIPPKNQRSMKTSISDSASEKEFYCIAPIHEVAESNVFTRSAAGGTNSKMFTNQNVKNACDYEIFYNKLHRESSERDKHFPFHAKSKRNTIVQQSNQSNHWYPQERKYVEYDSKKKVYTVPAEDEFHGPYHLRRSEYYNPKYLKFDDEVDDEREKADKSKNKNKSKDKDKDKDRDREKDNDMNNEKDMNREDREDREDRDKDNKNQGQNTSRRQMVDDEQVTDVRPKQGQNLKWKIIVKHHQDKNDGKAGETLKETSGSVGIPRRW